MHKQRQTKRAHGPGITVDVIQATLGASRGQSDKRQIAVGACTIPVSAKRHRASEGGYQGFSYKQRRAFPLA